VRVDDELMGRTSSSRQFPRGVILLIVLVLLLLSSETRASEELWADSSLVRLHFYGGTITLRKDDAGGASVGFLLQVQRMLVAAQ